MDKGINGLHLFFGYFTRDRNIVDTDNVRMKSDLNIH